MFVPEIDKFVLKKMKGKLFYVNGQKILLFRIGVLAKAIYRTTRTISDWERAGSIPKTIFEVINRNYTDDSEHRWYSEEQIKMMQGHMKDLFGNNLKSSKNVAASDKLERFFSLVRRDWAKGLIQND